ncbi:Uncharacterised protein [Serratia proteamaculans]|uniref:ead/Ea22-like family protein n=1 Tax=Serratia proteamaculans TaxID=28151 RepID=UPI00217A9582|nr:ead/Ea22-like family protein [Serratia proteamaculans]CAI1705226.1 Uncharacterised protein [Serratia proteamaculans]
MDKFSELKAVALAATPGPWSWKVDGIFYYLSPEGINTPLERIIDDGSAWGEYGETIEHDSPDARFIAAANPAVVLALLAELERGNGYLDDVRYAKGCCENAIAVREKRIAELEHEKGNRGEGWRPDTDPITGRAFFMWIAHPDKGMVPTYGGPYDSYTLATRDKDGSYFVERYDHDNGHWRTDCVEDCGVQVVDDQLYTSDEDPDDLKAEIAALRAKLATPVRLPGSFYPDGDIDCPLVVELDEVVEAIRSAGFTVEGDE